VEYTTFSGCPKYRVKIKAKQEVEEKEKVEVKEKD